MKQHPAWGVDVTGVSTRGVKLRVASDGRPHLVAWDVVDYAEEVDDLTSLTRFATMGRALFHFKSRHRLMRSRVWASIRSETAFNRTVRVPPVNDEGIDKLLEYEAQQQVPHPLEDVYWDRRVIDIREDGEVLATLYAVRKSVVEDRLRKFGKAGFAVDGLQLRSIALQNFCAYERLLEEGTIVVDVDYAGLQVLIHHNDQTWFRVLPLGGVDLVHRLRETFDCDHRAAVHMARGQTAPPDRELFEACRREVAQDIVDEAARTLRYYLAARPGMKPSGVVLLESHPCVPPVAEALKRSMGMTVYRPKGFRHLTVDPEVVTAGIQEHFPSLAKAVGLALQGVGKAEVDVRLYPPGLERNIDSRKAGYVLAALCVLAVLFIAGWHRRAAVDDIMQASADLRTAVEGGLDLDKLETRIDVEAPVLGLGKLADVGKERARPLLLVDHVYAGIAAQAEQDGATAPAVVSIRQTPVEGDAADVILALPVVVDGGDPGTTLEAFARSLVDGDLITGVAPGKEWLAGSITAAAPIEGGPTGPLRLRFLHRTFRFSLGRKL
jgi:type IV pilus assembly protein PilM